MANGAHAQLCGLKEGFEAVLSAGSVVGASKNSGRWCKISAPWPIAALVEALAKARGGLRRLAPRRRILAVAHLGELCPMSNRTWLYVGLRHRSPAEHPTIGDARPASEVVTRSPPTNEKKTFTFGWLRLLGTVRAWCRYCATDLTLVVALQNDSGAVRCRCS